MTDWGLHSMVNLCLHVCGRFTNLCVCVAEVYLQGCVRVHRVCVCVCVCVFVCGTICVSSCGPSHNVQCAPSLTVEEDRPVVRQRVIRMCVQKTITAKFDDTEFRFQDKQISTGEELCTADSNLSICNSKSVQT